MAQLLLYYVLMIIVVDRVNSHVEIMLVCVASCTNIYLMLTLAKFGKAE